MELEDIANAMVVIGYLVGGGYGLYRSLSLYHKSTPASSRRWFLYGLTGAGGLLLGQTAGAAIGLVLGTPLRMHDKIESYLQSFRW